MKNVKLLVSFVLCLCFYGVNGQEYKERFYEFLSEGETKKQLRVLEKWEENNNDDPELYVAYFNYYYHASKTETVAIGSNPKGDAMQIMDQDTSVEEPVAYIYGEVNYDPELLSKALDWIDRGIEKYPNRLDMRFGKIYTYGQIEDYSKFTNEIVRVINYSAQNENNWLWENQEEISDAKQVLLNTIQDYQIQLFDTGESELLENMKEIAEAILNHYPNHIESLSNISIIYIYLEEYDNALVYLLKAEENNPKDCVVLNNIAYVYKLKGDSSNAIKYYNRVIEYGNAEEKKYAEQFIEELTK